MGRGSPQYFRSKRSTESLEYNLQVLRRGVSLRQRHLPRQESHKKRKDNIQRFQRKETFCANMHSVLLVLIMCTWHFGHCSRQLELKINPGCDLQACKSDDRNDTSHVNLVYVRAVGEKDAIHYVWSTIGTPSVLIAFTSLNSELQIDWNRLTSNDSQLYDNSINFTRLPTYYYSLTITKLWQFHDAKDTGKLNPDSNETVSIDLDKLIWDNVNRRVKNETSHCSVTFVTRKNESSWIKEDGSLSLEVDIYGNEGRNDVLPRLQHTANSTQLHVVLDNFNPFSKEARYGMEFLIVTSATNESHLTVTTDATIDDEYTPGVFKTTQLTAKSGGYMYWKPVVYTSPDLIITNSTDSQSYTIVNYNISSLPYSIARAFLGSNATDIGIFSTNITFGSSKDEFYEKTYYQAWTVMIGVGSVPQDAVSVLVIVVIAAGLGLPLLIMTIGGIYLLIDKFRKQKDDLLLSQDGR